MHSLVWVGVTKRYKSVRKVEFNRKSSPTKDRSGVCNCVYDTLIKEATHEPRGQV